MDPYANFTRASWHATIDKLEQLELALQIPPWAVAVISLCALSILSMLVICGVACGIFVQQHVQKKDQQKRLLNSDSEVQELELQENIENAPAPAPTSKKRGKQRVSRDVYDDMEI